MKNTMTTQPTPTAPTRPELSFDGMGINGPNEYRDRLATFNRNGPWTPEQVQWYGRLFQAGPEMLDALESLSAWLVNAERELGRPITVGYAANIQKPVVQEKVRAILARLTP